MEVQSPPSPSLSKSLQALAWCLIVVGAVGILVIGVSLFVGSETLHIDPTYLVLPSAGAGLLRRSRGWRIVVLCLCWLNFIVFPIAAAVFLWMPNEVNVHFGRFHAKLADAPLLGWAGFAMTTALAISAYRVLTRPDVAQLFKRVGKDEQLAGSSQPLE